MIEFVLSIASLILLCTSCCILGYQFGYQSGKNKTAKPGRQMGYEQQMGFHGFLGPFVGARRGR